LVEKVVSAQVHVALLGDAPYLVVGDERSVASPSPVAGLSLEERQVAEGPVPDYE